MGFFGGTFDPIHLGHIHLAISLQERCKLDGVVFSPAFISPFKQKKPPVASKEHRLEMVRLAIDKIPGFCLNEEEILEKRVSYTIDGLRVMQQKFPNATWHLMLYEDNLDHLLEWKEIEEILRIAPPWIGSSGQALPQRLQGLERYLVQIPKVEISSTLIRERLKKGLYCGHLLDAKVLDFIYRNKLYFSINCKN